MRSAGHILTIDRKIRYNTAQLYPVNKEAIEVKNSKILNILENDYIQLKLND